MTSYLLDARGLAPRGDDGSGRVIRGLVQHLPALLRADERLLIIASQATCDSLSQRGAAARTTFVPCPVETASLRQHLEMPPIVTAIAPQVWLYPQYDLPPVPPGVASIAIVHDLTTVFEPGYYGAGRDLRRLPAAALIASTCARADVIVTDAEAIKSELAALFPHAAHRLRAITPGPSYLPTPPPSERHRDRFVYVGNHRPHKRVPLLLEAFARARRRRPSLQLTLAGRLDPRFPEVGELLRGPLGVGVTLVEGASDEQISQLLACARALVFPSVGEGFGFPVVEAFSVGTPCIIARAGSLPEVAGDAGLQVAPDDVAGLAHALVDLASSDELWGTLRDAIGRTLARYSWASYAEGMMAALRDAVAERQ